MHVWVSVRLCVSLSVHVCVFARLCVLALMFKYHLRLWQSWDVIVYDDVNNKRSTCIVWVFTSFDSTYELTLHENVNNNFWTWVVCVFNHPIRHMNTYRMMIPTPKVLCALGVCVHHFIRHINIHCMMMPTPNVLRLLCVYVPHSTILLCRDFHIHSILCVYIPHSTILPCIVTHIHSNLQNVSIGWPWRWGAPRWCPNYSCLSLNSCNMPTGAIALRLSMAFPRCVVLCMKVRGCVWRCECVQVRMWRFSFRLSLWRFPGLWCCVWKFEGVCMKVCWGVCMKVCEGVWRCERVYVCRCVCAQVRT